MKSKLVKRPGWKLVLLLVVVLLLSFNLFKGRFFVSQDGELHLARIAAYSRALRAGHFPVRWASELNFGYGYPIFNFVYPLPYLLASGLNLLGLDIFWSLKIVLFTSLFFSGLGVYLWLAEKFSWRAGLVGSLLYVSAPYRLVDLYVRVAFGEAVAFVFPGFLLYFYDRYQKDRRLKDLALSGLFYGLLILSHNMLALMFSWFFLAYILFSAKDALFKQGFKGWLKILLPLVLGLGLSSFFWLPALGEAKYTMFRSPLFAKDYQTNFVGLRELVAPDWGYGEETMSYQLGLVHWGFLLIFLSGWRWIKDKSLYLLLALTTFLGILLMLPVSKGLWQQIEFLQYFQNPTRFLGLVVFSVAVSGGIVAERFKNKVWLIGIGLVLSLGLALVYSRPKEYLSLAEKFYEQYPKSTTWHQEATPVWVGSAADAYPDQPVYSPEGALISRLVKGPVEHCFWVEAGEEALVVDNTLYFPGWRVYIDGQQVPVQFQDPRFRGLISFRVPKGRHQVKVKFGRTKLRLAGELISGLTGWGLILMLLVDRMGRIEDRGDRWR